MPSDYFNKAITSKLKPALVAEGFFRRRPKEFVRIRGELVDVISFQLSQYGSKKFYVHYFCNLLAHPEYEEPLISYRVGARLSAPHDMDVPWVGDTEEGAMSAIESLVSTYHSILTLWFSSIDNVRDWLVELISSPNSSVSDLDVAIALCLIDRKSRSWWILCELLDRCEEGGVKSEWKEMLLEFHDAISENRYLELLSRWKKEVISKNKIESAAA